MSVGNVPPRIPFLDPSTGLIAREWYLYLVRIATGVDDSAGLALGELAAKAIPETAAMLYSLGNDFGQASPPPAHSAPNVDTPPATAPFIPPDVDLASVVSSLSERVHELAKRVDDLRKGPFAL